MRPRVAALLAAALLAATSAEAGASPLASFFASRVVDYSPGPGHSSFPDPQLALAGPRGRGWSTQSLHVVTLGRQGELVLGFQPGQAIAEAEGPDFIVSENAFGTMDLRFAELVRVGVSTNGIDYAFFPTWCGIAEPPTSPQGPAYAQIDPALVSGFAGVEPVHANVGPPEEFGNDIDPFDPEQAGGDLFDLAGLAGHPLVLSGAVDLGRIYFVKLRDVLGDGSEQDSYGNAVYDPTGDIEPDYPTSADIDALTVLHGLPAPPAGDATRDGAVDGADYTLWADHFGLGGMTWEQGDFTGEGQVDGADYTIWADNYGSGGAGGAAVPAPSVIWLLAAGGALLRRRK